MGALLSPDVLTFAARLVVLVVLWRAFWRFKPWRPITRRLRNG